MSFLMSYKQIVPYTAVFLDTEWKSFFSSAWWCLSTSNNSLDERKASEKIKKIFKNEQNQNFVLPCLSVRTGLDLFLRVHNFPPSSEVIMSAINIPAMVTVLHSYGLKIISLDVDLETMAPRLDLIPLLVTSKTRLLLLANVFGRGYDLIPYINLAKKLNIKVIEDWAEGFSGFRYLGNPQSDLTLFSFGPIKYVTSFGGAIAKVRDEEVFLRMESLYKTYPQQTHSQYLKKVLKYSLVYILLNCPKVVKPGMFLTRLFGIDHKAKVISMLRGFHPDNMLFNIKQRPSTSLLITMAARFTSFDMNSFNEAKTKGDFAMKLLPREVGFLGNKSHVKNHWLFPVLVEDAEFVINRMNSKGVDAYRGATQLCHISSDYPQSKILLHNRFLSHFDFFLNTETSLSQFSYSSEIPFFSSNASFLPSASPSLSDYVKKQTSSLMAKKIMQHIIYLPINKTVPLDTIRLIISTLSEVLKEYNNEKKNFNKKIKTIEVNGNEKHFNLITKISDWENILDEINYNFYNKVDASINCSTDENFGRTEQRKNVENKKFRKNSDFNLEFSSSHPQTDQFRYNTDNNFYNNHNKNHFHNKHNNNQDYNNKIQNNYNKINSIHENNKKVYINYTNTYSINTSTTTYNNIKNENSNIDNKNKKKFYNEESIEELLDIWMKIFQIQSLSKI